MNDRNPWRRVAVAALLIAFACLLMMGLFVFGRLGENSRTCDAIERAFAAHDDVFYPALTERRPPLPPRDPADQKRIDDLIATVRHDTDEALAGACG